MPLDLPVPFDESFDALYGLQIVELGEERAIARVPVSNAIKQPLGLVHGGVFCAMAESLASHATAAVEFPRGNSVRGLSNQTSFIRPITEGTVHATALRRHRGRTTWIWDVEITDDRERLCAVSRMTIAVRPAPGPSRDSRS
ncbi:4-hydroxybenzoyl-CoA thioesterase [Capillimicrobium parvum]|uniref:4-hydroxybenzoyl-CoA thioesterase n=2 Tax=Capillimicrobium parvum TaxID=2884022 RepID=A0A9E6XY54_9ACTN|nr:4-hydroxybenzoyl-CoA thioesterase [Capillimicrobium parvum]